jgi:hypothetical protein
MLSLMRLSTRDTDAVCRQQDQEAVLPEARRHPKGGGDLSHRAVQSRAGTVRDRRGQVLNPTRVSSRASPAHGGTTVWTSVPSTQAAVPHGQTPSMLLRARVGCCAARVSPVAVFPQPYPALLSSPARVGGDSQSHSSAASHTTTRLRPLPIERMRRSCVAADGGVSQLPSPLWRGHRVCVVECACSHVVPP